MEHRHLTTEQAGRELTKAAIEDVIVRGGIDAWRGLAKAARDDHDSGIIPPWNHWDAVKEQCRTLAAAVLRSA